MNKEIEDKLEEISVYSTSGISTDSIKGYINNLEKENQELKEKKYARL